MFKTSELKGNQVSWQDFDVCQAFMDLIDSTLFGGHSSGFCQPLSKKYGQSMLIWSIAVFITSILLAYHVAVKTNPYRLSML